MLNEHRVIHSAYCGMRTIETAWGDMANARECAAYHLRRFRKAGFPVVTLKRGKEWEIQEPGDAALVPDECGILRIIEPDTAECDECGVTFTPEHAGYNAERFCSESCVFIYYGGSPIEDEPLESEE